MLYTMSGGTGMSPNFNELALIPHTKVIRAVGVSDPFGNRRLEDCIDAGIVKWVQRTPTRRTMLNVSDARAFYEALIAQ